MTILHATEDGSGTESGATYANSIAVGDINLATLSAGDEIKLYGAIETQLDIQSSGTVADPILITGHDAVLGHWSDWAGRTWTDEGSNIWSTPFTANDNNPLINFGAVGEYGERIDYIGNSKPFTKDKDWDADYVADKLFVYSVGNPGSYYGQIFVGDRPAIVIKDRNYITMQDLGFRHSALCVTALVRSTAVANVVGIRVLGGWFNNVGNGFRIGSDTATYTMRDCFIDGVVGDTYGEKHSHLYGRVGEGNYIINNRAINGGLSISTAAFYISEGVNYATGKSYIDSNYVDGYTYGRFWEFDGAGCFLDDYTNTKLVRRNFVKNTEGPCYKSNSGRATNVFERNIGIGGTYGFVHTDSKAVNAATTQVRNNTFVGASIHAVRVGNITGTVTVRNNILTTAGDGISYGATPTVSQSFNLFFGVAREVKQDGQEAVSGTTSITGNPRFIGGDSPTTAEGCRLRASSPARAAGTYLGLMKDYGNRRFKMKPSIGAWEAASGDEITNRGDRE